MENNQNNELQQRHVISLDGYIRQLNNEIFLSQNHLNGLYVLLLINRQSLWENIPPSDINMKEKVDLVIKNKITDIESILGALLKGYQQKIKNSHINWLQKFMTILKSRNKSIYIQKISHECQHTNHNNHSHQQIPNKMDNQLLTIFYGISNINALTGNGLGQFIEYNASQRYITFKMGVKYNLTIKNQDAIFIDTDSQLSCVPKEILTHHIFSYFNASELFQLRGVCKEWGDYVRESWHKVFKRQMLSQMLASEYCKQIELNYKILQLRNPFYQKLSLLLHALIEIINWEYIKQNIQNNTITLPFKRVLMVLLKLLGSEIPVNSLNEITDQFWDTHKHKLQNLKTQISEFFFDLTHNILTVQELKNIKRNFLDNPFMRVEEMNISEQKTPLLMSIFIKQFTLQSIIKNYILLTQEYLLNMKKRLDVISKEWPKNRGFLETAYKILLLKTNRKQNTQEKQQDSSNNTPDFSSLLKSIFEQQTSEFEKPDFVIKNKATVTNVYLDRRTKLDILISTFKQTNQFNAEETQQKQYIQDEKEQQKQGEQQQEKKEYKSSDTQTEQKKEQEQKDKK